MADERRYTLRELESETGLGRRQIRHYIQSGLAPGSQSRGPGSSYGATTLRRLRLAMALKSRPIAPLGRPLTTAEVRALGEQRGEAGLRWVLETGSLLSAPPEEAASTAAGRELGGLLRELRLALASLLDGRAGAEEGGWERWLRLRRADLELHLRRPLNSSDARRLRRLADDIAAVLGED